MEHRWEVRQIADKSVALLIDSVYSLPCTMRNFSAGGMFVETHGAVILPNATVVELAFSLDDDQNRVNLFRLKAMLVHRSDEGLGLQFLEIDDRLYQSYRRLTLTTRLANGEVSPSMQRVHM